MPFAEKVKGVPAQMVSCGAEIITDGITVVLTVNTSALEVSLTGEAHVALLVNIQIT